MNEHRRRFLAYFSATSLASTLLPGVLWTRLNAQQQSGQAPRITADMLKAAEQIAGLNFTDAQRALLIDDVNSHLTQYEHLRAIPLANSVVPCVRFSPVLPGMKFDMIRRPMRRSAPLAVHRPSNLEDVAFWPVTDLSALIATHQVRSVELTEMYLDRLKRYDPKLEFVVTFTDDLAMQQAKQADAEIAAGHYRGPLHGIPWGAKDLISKRGYKTTWGAVAFKNQSFDQDATIVARLQSAGAVLIAKLTTGELAGGDVWFGGKTKNPWNPAEGSSGSSAGPASATAAGCVGFAVGTETGGSIVSPSTRCGVYGMRPSYGRVSRHGVMTLAWSLDKAGPICRSVEDCALVLDALQGPDGEDLAVTNVPFNWNATIDIRKLRVGYLKAAFDEPRPAKEEADNDAAALDKLRAMGVQLKPIDFPNYPIEDLMRIMEVEFSAAFDAFTRNHQDDLMIRQDKDSDANLYRINRFVPAVEYIQALRVRTLLMEAMADTMSDIDVYLAPITSHRPPKPDSILDLNTTLTNLTGQPTVVVRDGFTATGIPTSITFTGKVYGEAKMLALARAYQMTTNWHTRHPNLS
ncbi:MAG TPA: amidase [Bryobacteraceae bacterium]|nr:amidase [Bryobacteraceae bacterium]